MFSQSISQYSPVNYHLIIIIVMLLFCPGVFDNTRFICEKRILYAVCEVNPEHHLVTWSVIIHVLNKCLIIYKCALRVQASYFVIHIGYAHLNCVFQGTFIVTLFVLNYDVMKYVYCHEFRSENRKWYW